MGVSVPVRGVCGGTGSADLSLPSPQARQQVDTCHVCLLTVTGQHGRVKGGEPPAGAGAVGTGSGQGPMST